MIKQRFLVVEYDDHDIHEVEETIRDFANHLETVNGKIVRGEGLSFAEALATHRPIRRLAWTKSGPTPAAYELGKKLLLENMWIYPRVMVEKAGETHWISLASGVPTSLNRLDYESCDWEAMP